MGLLKVKDAETGERIWVDTSIDRVRDDYAPRSNGNNTADNLHQAGLNNSRHPHR